MSNKKGFIFIETIVTIVVLAAALLYIYSNFNNILIKEKTRVHYDDVAYIYRTYYIKNFFAKYELNSVLQKLSEDNPMIRIGCDYGGIFGDRYNLINQDNNNDGIPDINIDSDGNGWPDTKIDITGDGTIEFQSDSYDYGTLNFDKDGDSNPDINIDYNNDGKPDINIDFRNDRVAHFNVEDSNNIYSSGKGKYICEELVNQLGITSIVVALNDLSYIKECDLDDNQLDNKCTMLKNFSSEKVVYLETLGDLTKTGKANKYVMIIEYTEKETYQVQNPKTEEYEAITKERFVHNYAWVRI